MRSFAIALAAAVPAFVSAQTTWTVNVGSNSQLTFDPPSMNASIGDSINFVFQSKNHSVFQSTFTAPCTPAPSGFSTPFFPVTGNNSQLPSVTMNVTQTAPIWFYCAQTIPANHCHAGMVGVVNPTADKTLVAFQAAAMNNSSSNSTNTTSAGSPSASGAPSASNTTTPSPKPNSAVRMGSGAALLSLISVAAIITTL